MPLIVGGIGSLTFWYFFAGRAIGLNNGLHLRYDRTAVRNGPKVFWSRSVRLSCSLLMWVRPSWMHKGVRSTLILDMVHLWCLFDMSRCCQVIVYLNLQLSQQKNIRRLRNQLWRANPIFFVFTFSIYFGFQKMYLNMNQHLFGTNFIYSFTYK